MLNTFVTYSAQQTRELAPKIIPLFKKNVICLYGNLGSGKTTFIQGLAKALGIIRQINSPTFIFINEYPIAKSKYRWKNLVHIDCYRLKSAADMKAFDLTEYWQDKSNLVVIEWANNIWPILPKNKIEMEFTYLKDNKRQIKIL